LAAKVKVKSRFQRVVEGIKYDLSKDQTEMLSKKTIKLPWPTPWDLQRRVNGLVARSLVALSSSTARTITYKRTEMGDKVYKALTAKK